MRFLDNMKWPHDCSHVDLPIHCRQYTNREKITAHNRRPHDKNNQNRNGCPQGQFHLRRYGAQIRRWEDIVFSTVEVGADSDLVVDYIEYLKEKFQDNYLDIECGYEAGRLGYVLYAELKAKEVKQAILAPTMMMTP